MVGFQVDHPFTVKEKVEAVHELAVDEQVAARVVTDLLHRPDVAFKAMADDTAKQMVNRAQVDHAFQAMERNIEPVAPILREVARPLQFVDLIAACALFASSIERAMPQLHGHRFTEQEQEAVRDRLRQVRAAADWVEHAIETGDTTLEESLAALLRNPGPDPA